LADLQRKCHDVQAIAGIRIRKYLDNPLNVAPGNRDVTAMDDRSLCKDNFLHDPDTVPPWLCEQSRDWLNPWGYRKAVSDLDHEFS
jgi:hypothetical protein